MAPVPTESNSPKEKPDPNAPQIILRTLPSISFSTPTHSVRVQLSFQQPSQDKPYAIQAADGGGSIRGHRGKSGGLLDRNTLREVVDDIKANMATKADVDKLSVRIDKSFDVMNRTFDTIDNRFDAIDQKLTNMEQKIGSIEGSIAALNTIIRQSAENRDRNFTNLYAGLTSINDKLNMLVKALGQKFKWGIEIPMDTLPPPPFASRRPPSMPPTPPLSPILPATTPPNPAPGVLLQRSGPSSQRASPATLLPSQRFLQQKSRKPIKRTVSLPELRRRGARRGAMDPENVAAKQEGPSTQTPTEGEPQLRRKTPTQRDQK